MQKVIVTGGAGFIGSHTVIELLDAHFQPIIVDNFSNSEERVLQGIEAISGHKVKCYRVDCNDRDALRGVFQKEGEILGVIHFAAFKAVGESVRDPLKYYRNNIGSMMTLLEVMQEFEVKNLVFSSSCTVYGEPKASPVTEDTPVQPALSPYGQTKQVCESLCKDVAVAKTGMNSVILRYFNPIGAHPSGHIGELPLGKPENLVPYITQTAIGLREALTIFGDDYETPDGTCVRDYIHVVDLAKAHVKALSWLDELKAENVVEIFNIGTGKGSSVQQLVDAFIEVTGVDLNYQMGPRRPGDIPAIWADSQKSNQILGWNAELSMEDALRDAWTWEQQIER